MQDHEVPLSTQTLITHILVALDGSAFAERILPHVVMLAQTFGAAVTLLHVTTPATALIGIVPAVAEDPRTVEADEQQKGDAYLHALAQRLRDAGVRVASKQQAGNPATIIRECVPVLGVDLIAMTTHGRTGVQHFVFGSVAEEVLRTAPCPILLVRVRE